jgi:hypothetical protein
MFWAFKLSFVVDILVFFDLATFWAIFEKFGKFFSNLLVTLLATLKGGAAAKQIWRPEIP